MLSPTTVRRSSAGAHAGGSIGTPSSFRSSQLDIAELQRTSRVGGVRKPSKGESPTHNKHGSFKQSLSGGQPGGAKLKLLIRANPKATAHNPYKFCIHYEFRRKGENVKIFPPVRGGTAGRTHGSLGAKPEVRSSQLSGSFSKTDSKQADQVAALTQAMDADTPHADTPQSGKPVSERFPCNQRLEGTLDKLELSEQRKSYIKQQIHAKMCGVTAALLESMPADPRAFLVELLQSRATASGTAVPLSELSKAKLRDALKPDVINVGSEKKKQFLHRVHPLVSALVQHLVENSPQDIDRFLLDTLVSQDLIVA